MRRRSGKLRAISLCCALLTLELATRFFRPGPLNLSQFDPEVGYLLQPNLQVTITDRESRVTHELRANSLGFRGSEWVVPKPHGVKRIAVLGDSFVEARSYEERQTFCGRLEQLLNDSSASCRWEVMNLGVQGHNTSSQLAVYEKFVRPLDADFVILCMTLSNDVRENVRELSNCFCVFSEFGEDGRVTTTPPRRAANQELKNQFQFYLWQKAKMQLAVDSFRNATALEEFYDPIASTRKKKLEEARCLTAVPLDERYARAWTVTSKLLDRFRAQVEKDGRQFYVVSLPNAWQVHGDLFDLMRNGQSDPGAYEIDQPTEQLAQIAGQLGIDLLELTPSFREELASSQAQNPLESHENLLFLNGVGHFAERAHEVVAREIFQYLTSNEEDSAPSRRADMLAAEPRNDSSARQ